MEQLYEYRWGNHKTAAGKFRLQFKGRTCKILARGKLNSRLVQFVDNGELLNCSGNALMRRKP